MNIDLAIQDAAGLQAWDTFAHKNVRSSYNKQNLITGIQKI